RPVSGGCVRFAVLVLSRLPAPTLFPYTTLFRSNELLSALRKTQGYDLLLLGWEMPDISGLDVLHWARGNFGPALPIMFLTSRTLEEDLVTGLRAGPDDYMIKPIRPGALRAITEALLLGAHCAPTR